MGELKKKMHKELRKLLEYCALSPKKKAKKDQTFTKWLRAASNKADRHPVLSKPRDTINASAAEVKATAPPMPDSCEICPYCLQAVPISGPHTCTPPTSLKRPSELERPPPVRPDIIEPPEQVPAPARR